MAVCKTTHTPTIREETARWSPDDAIAELVDWLPVTTRKNTNLHGNVFVALEHIADLQSVCSELLDIAIDECDDKHGPVYQIIRRAQRVLLENDRLEAWER